jgi:hypothetical protein
MAAVALAMVFMAGCAGRAPVAGISDIDSHDSRSGVRSNVLTATELQNEGGSLLEAMVRRLNSFRVDNRFQCPAISLRGSVNTVPGLTEPDIFIDGIRAIDTCILGMISATDVGRVEVYPSGITERPGYSNSAHGLILVFTRKR